MRLAAHAKVNLTLEILGTRPDGYHELRSVVAEIPLHDDVELLDAPAGEVTVEMSGDGMEVPCVPCEENLAVRAARALAAAAGVSRGVRIRIVKRIPVGAGLGGGSADAAAVLNGLNELWGLKLPNERLCAIGAEVGSDVPALVLGGMVLMEGRGERVRPFERSARPTTEGLCVVRPFDDHFVLRIPPVCASTARVYAEFRAEDCGKFRNDLQPAACRLYPAIAETIAEMEAEGLEDVQMTGSGSAVFGWRKES
jgi:4-diphosphocytidyl-2-C-methyl-D-erythritol kinase